MISKEGGGEMIELHNIYPCRADWFFYGYRRIQVCWIHTFGICVRIYIKLKKNEELVCKETYIRLRIPTYYYKQVMSDQGWAADSMSAGR